MTIEQSTIALVITTLDDPRAADELSARLLADGLVACVNILGPVRSAYHWQGELCRDEEYQLHMKTSLDRIDDLKDAIEQYHPYDCPEVVILPAESSQSYSEWVQQCVQTTP
ncbi:divalent-cation tolerance protein CutA [Guyparkeria halophila]|uniref:Divalent-cation tolerance protein CutA n=1 Tax=Guyparkeria halophila TaxID=47960 RepID=A0ABZ0YXT2_9GAMM|nr:divalent-cation tolerance protein CutA [Guyparkeria halophila]WQH16990.1 divalent-cation tolerance protein CutA [Guyparkeria halophila]